MVTLESYPVACVSDVVWYDLSVTKARVQKIPKIEKIPRVILEVGVY